MPPGNQLSLGPVKLSAVFSQSALAGEEEGGVMINLHSQPRETLRARRCFSLSLALSLALCRPAVFVCLVWLKCG